MNKQTILDSQEELKKLEGTMVAIDVPRLENPADLALFYKKAIHGEVLYTNIQDESIQYFVGKDYSQMHQNMSFELLYVLSGSIINRIEDKEYVYTAGQGCLFNRRITHSDIIEEGQMLVLNFSETILKEVFSSLKNASELEGPVFQFLLADLGGKDNWKRNYIEFSLSVPQEIGDTILNNLFDAIQMELATSKIGASYFQKGLLLRILSELENQNAFQLKNVNIDQNKEEFLVSRLMSLIDSHYGKISRKEIEKTLHYNPEYLNRLLKKQSQMTITSYAKRVRINKAKQLLRNTDVTIAQIVTILGFSSENYFYHFFKEETGMSPNQYRTDKSVL